MQPIIKWAGGKRKFANQIASFLGDVNGTYYEPFLGGGALLLHITPEHAVCSDINPELVNFYQVVKHNVDALIDLLKVEFVPNHSKEFYYQVRGWDRNKIQYSQIDSVRKAARFIYLNKTCYNGLWRVNRDGMNNVPFGRYKRPTILLEEDLRQAAKYLKEKDISFIECDYKELVNKAVEGDTVYFDPPYDVEAGQSEFVSYTATGFSRKDQEELKKLCDLLIDRGVKVGISNSNTQFIRSLYSSDKNHSYTLNEIAPFSRTIGSKPASRKKTTELIIIGNKK